MAHRRHAINRNPALAILGAVIAWVLPAVLSLAHPHHHPHSRPQNHPDPYANEPPTPDSDPATTARLSPLDPADFNTVHPSPLLRRLLDDPLTTDAQRLELRIFHGLWQTPGSDAPGSETADSDDPGSDSLDPGDLSPDQRARLAIAQHRFEDVDPADAAVDATLRAKAVLGRGRAETVIDLLTPILTPIATPGDADTPTAQPTDTPARLLLAQAHDRRGEPSAAIAALAPVRRMLATQLPDFDAASLTAAAEGLALLARLEGRPARDYETVLNLLARARFELDRLYWPALLAEARVLHDKHNLEAAAEALQETLTLNPACIDAWALLGTIAAEGYNFDLANTAVNRIRRVNPDALAADLVAVRALIRQRDTDAAHERIAEAIQRHPRRADALALAAAVEALRYERGDLDAALQRFDALASHHPPGSALAHYQTAIALAAHRQFDLARPHFEAALAREPNWTNTRLDFGLMLMDAGDVPAAADQLRRATALDPYNQRANNQLKLADELLDYAILTTKHFEIRYRPTDPDHPEAPGVDAVLARDMARRLDRLAAPVIERFGHAPPYRVQIDLMPDRSWFAVRMTGLPDIWTIAAATGRVVSLTPPRYGADQAGPFWWPNVLTHEYVHSVNIAQTHGRVPHWFTEACAVTQELGGFVHSQARLVAEAIDRDRLFTLANINNGFIRPTAPWQRPLAYAQAAMMLMYIEDTWTTQATRDLLDRFADGVGAIAAVQQVTGLDEDAFLDAFTTWANRRLAQWGLGPHPDDRPLLDHLDQLARQYAATDPRDNNAVEARNHARVQPGHEPPTLSQRIDTRFAALAPVLPPSDWQALEDRFPDHPRVLRHLAEHHAALALNPTSNPQAAMAPDPTPQAAAEHGSACEDGGAANRDLNTQPQPTAAPRVSAAQRQRAFALAQRALHAYAHAAPLDPWPHLALARLAAQRHDRASVADSLRVLASRHPDTGDWAYQLSRIEQAGGDFDTALDAAGRSLDVEPYNAIFREHAAVVALQAGRPQQALHHLQALATLEPDNPRHPTRLAALHHRLGHTDAAHAAARRALELNPNAPVQPFLNQP